MSKGGKRKGLPQKASPSEVAKPHGTATWAWVAFGALFLLSDLYAFAQPSRFPYWVSAGNLLVSGPIILVAVARLVSDTREIRALSRKEVLAPLVASILCGLLVRGMSTASAEEAAKAANINFSAARTTLVGVAMGLITSVSWLGGLRALFEAIVSRRDR